MLEQQVWTPQTQVGGKQDLIRILGSTLSGLEFLLLLVLCTLTKIYDYVASKGMYSIMFLLYPISLYLNRKHRKCFYRGRKK